MVTWGHGKILTHYNGNPQVVSAFHTPKKIDEHL